MHAKRTTAHELQLRIVAMILCWCKLITASMMHKTDCSGEARLVLAGT